MVEDGFVVVDCDSNDGELLLKGENNANEEK
jgi:hypothetical protein